MSREKLVWPFPPMLNGRLWKMSSRFTVAGVGLASKFVFSKCLC